MTPEQIINDSLSNKTKALLILSGQSVTAVELGKLLGIKPKSAQALLLRLKRDGLACVTGWSYIPPGEDGRYRSAVYGLGNKDAERPPPWNHLTADDACEKMIAVLGRCTAITLSDNLGVRPKTARNKLRRLEDEGKVRCVNGEYEIVKLREPSEGSVRLGVWGL